MGVLGRIFGSDQVIEKATDGIYNGIDSVVYTAQEKEEMRQRSLDRLEKLLTLYEPFKLMQRFVAALVGIPYITIHLFCAMLFIYGLITGEVAETGATFREASASLAAFNNDSLGTPFSLIVGFYFAGGAIEGIVRKYKESK